MLKGRGAAWPAAQGESGWADAGARRSHCSQASLQASPARPTAGRGTVAVPSPPCRDAWQHRCQGRGHQAALPLNCPRDAGGTQGGHCTTKSRHHHASDVPQAGTDPIPSVSPPSMSPGSHPTAHPHQEGSSRARTEVTQCAQPCRSGLRYHEGHQPLHPAAAAGIATSTHGTARRVMAPNQPTAGQASSPSMARQHRTEKAMHREAPRGCDGGSSTKTALISTQIRAGPSSRAV